MQLRSAKWRIQATPKAPLFCEEGKKLTTLSLTTQTSKSVPLINITITGSMQIIVSSLLCILAICTVVASFNAGTLWVGPCRRDMNRGVGHLCAAVQGREPMSVLAKEVFDVDHRPVILYDGVCNMCNNFVTTLLDLDKEEKFRFSALQGQTGQALLVFSKRSPTDISRWGSICRGYNSIPVCHHHNQPTIIVL